MAAFDALIVHDEWISEHYFITDDVAGSFRARVKGQVAEWRAWADGILEARTPLERYRERRRELISALLRVQDVAADLDVEALDGEAAEDKRRALLTFGSHDVMQHLLYILGFTTDSGAWERWEVESHGPLHLLAAPGVGAQRLAVLEALPAEDPADVLAKSAGYLPEDVLLPSVTEGEEPRCLTRVPEVLTELAMLHGGLDYLMVIAGRTLVLTSAKQWPQGRYLMADVQTIAERDDTRRQGEVERFLVSFAASSTAPDAEGSIWWDETHEQAVKNAVGVSADLRDGVRDSIEIIANDVIRRRRAQGLPPLPAEQSQELALHSLRYLFRILFLLYAEASPQLGVLPVGAAEYDNGYAVGRLRELALREVPTSSTDGTYLYESLALLFHLVNEGHEPRGEDRSLRFESLKADLFLPERTALINDVQLGNGALNRVLENLLLSKEKKGASRGAISYVALGINQLGAVYEQLMSYTGAFADGEMVEVAPKGDAHDGSWVVPAERLDESLAEHQVMVEVDDGRRVPRRYSDGEFVFRLSGRARQQSASYYSPEVLTRFTVSQGLAELLDPVVTDESALPEDAKVFGDVDFEGESIRRRRTTAAEILEMTICEPALGSGAFAIEAVRQLATEYLRRRQKELGQQIDPEEYAQHLQRVKAYIALHNVYGVDLNPTAVELAEVSLWLDTMAPGLKAPWFGLRLRAGNSLIGARHSVYTTEQLRAGELKKVVAQPPMALSLSAARQEPSADGTRADISGKVFHFLLPGEGWLAAAGNTEVKNLAPEQAAALRKHARAYGRKLTAKQVTLLEQLSGRVAELWQVALRRLIQAEEHSRRSIDVWGATTRTGGEVTRAEIEESLKEPGSAYQRLRLIMDAWCALWFWPVLPNDDVAPPTLEEWLEVLHRLLGESTEVIAHAGGEETALPEAQGHLFSASIREWNELNQVENFLFLGGAEEPEEVVARTAWLQRTREIAAEQRFFHWHLDFAPVMARGGFDLQVGNPPWVRPRPDAPALLSEFDPWWTLTHKPSEEAKKTRRQQTMELPGAESSLLLGLRDVAATAEVMGSPALYPELRGTQPDLYRAFMAATWAHQAADGVVALVHPPTHLTDAKGYALRGHTYRRLRRMWRFINELKLFAEVHDLVEYSISVYAGERQEPDYLTASALYHPAVAVDSLRHDGSGPQPGFKNAEGQWDLTPHRARIIHVTRDVLEVWHRLMEGGDPEVPVLQTRAASTVNQAALAALDALTEAQTIGSLEPQFSRGWDESIDRRKGYFETSWGRPTSWRDAILQGPYFHVGTPFFNERNSTVRGNQDYSPVDLTRLPVAALPATEYKPIYGESGDRSRYDAAYGIWNKADPTTGEQERTPVRDHYRVFWRAMAAGTGERTLVSAIYPPGTATVNSVFAYGLPSSKPTALLLTAASMSSLLSDLLVRSTVGSGIYEAAARRLPALPADHPLASAAILRTLRLNALTDAYAQLWEEAFDPVFTRDAWTGGAERANRPALGDVGPTWTADSPLRWDEDRRQALVEIDAIMAIITGISIDDLVTIYRTQFAVLNDYDRGEGRRAYIYDANGRQLAPEVRTAWNKAGRPKGMPFMDRTITWPTPDKRPGAAPGHEVTYEMPFRILDREADLRAAYTEFTRRMEGDMPS